LKHVDFEIITRNAAGNKIIRNMYDCFATELLFGLNLGTISESEVKRRLFEKQIPILNYTEEEIITWDTKTLNNVLRNVLNYEYRLMSEGKSSLADTSLMLPKIA